MSSFALQVLAARFSSRSLLTSVCVLAISGTNSTAQTMVQLDTIVIEGSTTTSGDGTGAGEINEQDGFVARRTGATKINTPLIETPQSISVVTSDQIEQQNARSVAAALRYSAGVGTEVTGGRDTRYGGLEIRGFDVTDEAMFRDGLLLPYTAFANFGSLDPYGAARLDVIKGPASVLFGSGSPGGIINYVSKRPTAGRLRETVLEGSSLGTLEGRFDVSDKINEEGTWRYRLTGVARKGGSEVDYVDDSRFFIAPVLEWTPDADTTLTFLANYQRDRAGWGLQFLPYEGTVTDNPGRRISRHTFLGQPGFDSYDTDQASIGYQFEHRMNEAVTVRQNLRYGYLANDQTLAYGGGYADIDGDGEPDPASGILNRYANDGTSRLHTFSVDSNAETRFDTGLLSHTLLTGIDYRWTGYTDRSDNFVVDPINAFAPVYGSTLDFDSYGTDSRVRQNQTGIYIQDNIRIDRLSILLGGRQDFSSIDTRNYLDDSQADSSPSDFSGRAALIYNFDNGLAPYVSYSESFLQPLDLDADGALFDPETGRQWEAGLKFQPDGINALFTVAVFDIVRDNVVRYGDPAGPSQTGEITSRGIELEGVASLTDSLNLRASYAYQEVEFTDNPVAGLIGNTPYTVPKNRASLWADYTLRGGALDGFGLGGGVRYVGESYADDANTVTVPSFTVFDTALSYRRDNYDFQLNVSNLFNKTYVASCFDTGFGCFYGEGRRITGKATIRW